MLKAKDLKKIDMAANLLMLGELFFRACFMYGIV
jgi:hypothetical protein